MAPVTASRRAQVEFTVPIAEVKFDASGDPEAKGRWTMRGHAAVYGRKSHDLGGFRTLIAQSAFDKVLDANPDVHLLWDHDTRLVLARTKNNSLELRSDPYGLHVWARFAKTQTADELATLMAGGFIDQMSFACDIGEDEWHEDKNGEITRTIHTVDALYDVTVCAQGAFPQTDSQLVASFREAGTELAAAQAEGRVIRRGEQDTDHVAASRGEGGDGIAQNEGAADVAFSARLKELQEHAEARFSQIQTP